MYPLSPLTLNTPKILQFTTMGVLDIKGFNFRGRGRKMKLCFRKNDGIPFLSLRDGTVEACRRRMALNN